MRFVVPLVALACLLGDTAGAARPPERVVVLSLEGPIHPAALRYLRRGIETADRTGAALTLVELSTPGGLLTSVRQMTSAITGASRPVVVYVTPAGAQAASAGFFLLLAADVAAMTPGTNTGAAHPVGGGGQDLPKTLETKATNDAAALARALASTRGRSVAWAEKAVQQSLVYTAEEARGRGLIDVVAQDRAALLEWLDGRTVRRWDGKEVTLDVDPRRVEILSPDAGDRLLGVIAHPEVAYLLLLIGLAGLMTELTHPGLILPGVLGAACLLLGLFALSVLPMNVVGLVLIVAALGFFVAEALVTSYGLLALAGIASLLLGAILLTDAPIPGARLSLALVLPTALGLGMLTLLLVTRVTRLRRLPPSTGREGLVGEVGEAVVPLEPEGKVLVHGEYWDAVSPRPLPRGARVRIVEVLGRSLRVEGMAGDTPPVPVRER
jgi:membrane-bound serine protease (ClpP class)